jgi:hypothetical protein
MTDNSAMSDDRTKDTRSDLQQAVEARADAVKRGEGGDDDSALAPSGVFDGNSGSAGEVKNQDRTQQ